jgi:AcrR family transcriptional regulator
MPPGRRARPQPRKRPQQERSRATVEVILAGAEKILNRDGLDALTTARVAETAGISVGSLYQYFPNKEAIFAALLERSIDQYYEAMRTALEATRALPFEPAMRLIIDGLVRYYQRAPKMHAGLHDVVTPAGQRDLYRRYLARHTETIAAYFTARAADVHRSPELAAYVLVHCADGLGQAIARDQPDEARLRALIDEIGELVVRYLRAAPAGGP